MSAVEFRSLRSAVDGWGELEGVLRFNRIVSDGINPNSACHHALT